MELDFDKIKIVSSHRMQASICRSGISLHWPRDRLDWYKFCLLSLSEAKSSGAVICCYWSCRYGGSAAAEIIIVGVVWCRCKGEFIGDRHFTAIESSEVRLEFDFVFAALGD